MTCIRRSAARLTIPARLREWAAAAAVWMHRRWLLWLERRQRATRATKSFRRWQNRHPIRSSSKITSTHNHNRSRSRSNRRHSKRARRCMQLQRRLAPPPAPMSVHIPPRAATLLRRKRTTSRRQPWLQLLLLLLRPLLHRSVQTCSSDRVDAARDSISSPRHSAPCNPTAGISRKPSRKETTRSNNSNSSSSYNRCPAFLRLRLFTRRRPCNRLARCINPLRTPVRAHPRRTSTRRLSTDLCIRRGIGLQCTNSHCSHSNHLSCSSLPPRLILPRRSLPLIRHSNRCSSSHSCRVLCTWRCL